MYIFQTKNKKGRFSIRIQSFIVIGWMLFYTVEADNKNNSSKSNNIITYRKQRVDNNVDY